MFESVQWERPQGLLAPTNEERSDTLRGVPTAFDTRVAAYGVIVRSGQILLAHWNAYGTTNWTLPGGGLEFGEDPATAARREILEETGYHVCLERLLGVDNAFYPAGKRMRSRGHHSFRVIYEARIDSGELANEANGTTDEARWFPLDEVPGLERVKLVDVAIDMWRRQTVPHEEAV
ncbi:MAG TPA: NUDIX hydrolase [Trueperaceae bacterium]